MPAETALAAQFGVNRSTVREGTRSLEQNGLVRTQRALDNRESLTELDIKFHHLVAVAAHNPALLLSREPLSHLFYPAFYPEMDRLNARAPVVCPHPHRRMHSQPRYAAGQDLDGQAHCRFSARL